VNIPIVHEVPIDFNIRFVKPGAFLLSDPDNFGRPASSREITCGAQPEKLYPAVTLTVDFNLRRRRRRLCVPFVIIINVRVINQFPVGKERKEMASKVIMLQFGEGVRS